jgi:hypothetical protein
MKLERAGGAALPKDVGQGAEQANPAAVRERSELVDVDVARAAGTRRAVCLCVFVCVCVCMYSRVGASCVGRPIYVCVPCRHPLRRVSTDTVRLLR